MKHVTEKLRKVMILGWMLGCLVFAGIVGYCGAPRTVSETKITTSGLDTAEYTIETKIKPSHVGAALVDAADLKIPIGQYVQMIEAPKVNPYTGRPEVDYSSRGTPLYVPHGAGACKTYMNWSSITDSTTKQFQLRVQAENYDENDFGKVGDRYAVAVKPYYGKIGDYLDVIQVDDSVIRCIIAEYKGDENVATDGENAKYYHHDGSIIEFVVNYYAWYETNVPRTVYDYHPEWKQNIKSIYNVGNYWNE